MQLPNPLDLDPIIGFAIPVFILLIFVEVYILRLEHKPMYDKLDAWASIGMGVGSAVINVVTKTSAFILYMFLYQFRIFDLGTAWWVWILLFFADDLSFYVHHRMCHEVRIFWAAHVNHHSSQEYNLAVALRQSWGELFHKYIWWIWLPLVGFHPLMILTVMTISLIYQFWLHTQTINRFPRVFEFFFNTPSHHRVHHGSNVRYLDRNHAGVLIIWDRMFGTFQEEMPEEPVKYGITTNIHTYNPFVIATHEYGNLIRDVRNAPSFKAKLGYIFKPPGWSHDGSTLTADQMRKAQS